MKLGRLNHVGVAVPSIEGALGVYRKLFDGLEVSDVIELPKQGVRVRFVATPNSEIELLEPMGEDSPIAKFLERHPQGGQHHLAFEVADIYVAMDEAKAAGASVLGEPRKGAHGVLVVFIHPKDFAGVLLELMETPSH